MKNVLLHVLPQFLVPAAFGYCLWGSRNAEGWGGLVLGACLGFIVPFSGIAGVAFAGLSLLQRRRDRQDWRWLLVSAGIVGSPAVVALLHLILT
jgi:hypothetical protein